MASPAHAFVGVCWNGAGDMKPRRTRYRVYEIYVACYYRYSSWLERAHLFVLAMLTLQAYPVGRSDGAKPMELPFAVDEALEIGRQKSPDGDANIEVVMAPSTQQHQVWESVESKVEFQ